MMIHFVNTPLAFSTMVHAFNFDAAAFLALIRRNIFIFCIYDLNLFLPSIGLVLPFLFVGDVLEHFIITEVLPLEVARVEAIVTRCHIMTPSSQKHQGESSKNGYDTIVGGERLSIGQMESLKNQVVK